MTVDIAENLRQVKDRIARAAALAGTKPEDVRLVGATKMNDAARVQQAVRAGLLICGENRVQELLEKEKQGAYVGAELHFIGHLQRNKVKNVVGLCSLIHGADSGELLREIDRAAGLRGLTQDVLLEVNIAQEPAKSGFRAEDIPAALELAAALPHIRVRGLMAVPPICLSGEDNIPYFHSMKQLFVDNGVKKYDNVRMDFLSMGMSGDFEAALACGANMVRIGTAVFGPRPQSRPPV